VVATRSEVAPASGCGEVVAARPRVLGSWRGLGRWRLMRDHGSFTGVWGEVGMVGRRRELAEARARSVGGNGGSADGGAVSAIKPYEGFGDVDHTIKELMSL
jgi:hypothetical protein